MWTADDVVTALSGSFLIVKKAVVEIPPERGPVLQFPRLAVSDVQVGANSEGFVITFGYKNAGTAALPKGSQMPVKPTFRVLIDSREIAKGDLFIPESPAPPGWTVPTFQGGVIKYLPPAGGLDYNWSIGTIVTVKINENKINGMESDSQSYNLKPMALNFGFDALITGVTMDWDKETITVNVRLDGQIGGFSQFMLFDNGVQTRFQQTIRINSGQRLYAVTQKVEGMRWCAASGCPVDLYLMVLRPGGGWAADTRDIDQRNNRHAHTYRR
jgi:hypothetical protein